MESISAMNLVHVPEIIVNHQTKICRVSILIPKLLVFPALPLHFIHGYYYSIPQALVFRATDHASSQSALKLPLHSQQNK
ncbi:hypothetical protein D5086_005724 [Populus alba]|uniref:Uncharacterized protein n=1 Tax=Populus alba TaxID=43335 RepID=A0ACC4CV90_POPAL